MWRDSKAFVVAVIGVPIIGLGIGALLWMGAFDFEAEPPRAFCPEAYDSDEVAESSELDARTEPMAATGPRPMLLFDVVRSEPNAPSGVDDGTTLDNTGEIGKVQPAWRAEDNGKVQVLVCEYRHHVGEDPDAGTCGGYSNGTRSVPVSSARYTYKIYEASTKKQLDTFELRGVIKSADCPDQVWYRQGEEPRLWADPDLPELVNRLRPFVEPGSAR
jgi:hypothetical protein